MKILLFFLLTGLLMAERIHVPKTRSPTLRSASAPREKTPSRRIPNQRPARYDRKDHKPRSTAERAPEHKDFNYDEWGR